jgi:hypothetical protein
MPTPQWPPSSISVQPYPALGLRVVREGPNVLKTTHADGSQDVRVKSGVVRLRIIETWELVRSDTKLLLDFFDLVGLDTPFSAYTLDAQDGDDFGSRIGLFTFERSPDLVQVGPNWYRSEWERYGSEL